MKDDRVQIEDLSSLNAEEISARYRAQRVRFAPDVEDQVKRIIDDIAERGDAALIEYTLRFDGVSLSRSDIQVGAGDVEEGSKGVANRVARALDLAIERVKEFHTKEVIDDWTFVDSFGNRLGKKRFALERVGVYIPGGKASYPSTLVMTAVPAMVAGVKEIALVSPPSSFVSPSPLAACVRKLSGISDVYRVGGVQAVAALALGTETVRRVDKVVGPGNIYVAVAKKLLYGYTDIDMIAGPSEVLVLADGSVAPRLAAVDLMAQAEHDELARAMCVTWSKDHAHEVKSALAELLGSSPRAAIIEKSLRDNGRIYLVRDEECALALTNAIAPEHLEIQTARPEELLEGVRHAGAIFLGKYSAEAFGDYVAGPSHVLPTSGTARFFSPLSTLSFTKFSSIVEMSEEGARRIGEPASILARAEGLFEHARSIDFRKGE